MTAEATARTGRPAAGWRPAAGRGTGGFGGLVPGAVVTLGLLGLLGAAAGGLLAIAGRIDLAQVALDPYVLGVLRFTVWQAFLSAAISVLLAIPVARALARRPAFPGRALLVRLLGLPMVVPTIVGVLGIVAIWGRSGLINEGFEVLGLPVRLDIYGLSGILIAHVFFNMPFATRLFLQAFAAIPGESWRLAGQLGMSGPQTFRLIEWPAVREVAPGIFSLVFLLCFTSFAVVLTLGGGPPNATLEVAIYQALRFDFDLPRVLAFAVLQVGLCALLVALAQRFARSMETELTLARVAPRWDGTGWLGRIGDGSAIAFGAAVMGLPLGAVVVAGLTGPVVEVMTMPGLWQATGRSLAVGIGAGLLALALGWGLILSARHARVRLLRRGISEGFDLLGSIVLVVPPFVIAAGLFVLLRGRIDVFDWALLLVVLVNALMGLPFVLRILGPPAVRVLGDHWRLAASLGMGPLQRFRLIDWPLLRRPAALALAVSTALSLGDLGVIALFGSQDTRTLPLMLYQLLGNYRSGEATVIALWLILLTVGVFVAIERLGGGRADR